MLILGSYIITLVPIMELVRGFLYSGLVAVNRPSMPSLLDILEADESGQAKAFINRRLLSDLRKEVSDSMEDLSLKSKMLALIEKLESNKNLTWARIVGNPSNIPSFIETRELFFIDNTLVCQCLVHSFSAYQITVAEERHFGHLEAYGFFRKETHPSKHHGLKRFRRMISQLAATGLAANLENQVELVLQEYFRWLANLKSVATDERLAETVDHDSRKALGLTTILLPFTLLCGGYILAGLVVMIELVAANQIYSP